MFDSEDSLVGQVLEGRYIVEAEIGRGAMGVVYRGRHLKIGRKVAIKVLHRRLLEQPTMLERFDREVAAAAKLRHGNLVGVLDVAELADGRRVMVLEYAHGASLADLVGPGRPMAPARAIALLRGICDGLDEAHRIGLVHRDLKPENIVVEQDAAAGEVPRVIDFGIAILRAPAPHGDETAGATRLSQPRLTELGTVLGTPAYMAPEQALGEEVDARCDLFALGVIAYEMLTGRVPFDGSGVEIVGQTVAKPLPPMAARAPAGWPGVDARLEAVVRRLTARQRADRFVTAREVRVALDAIAERPPARDTGAVARPTTTGDFSEPTTLGGAAAASVTPSEAIPRAVRATHKTRGRGVIALAVGTIAAFATIGAISVAVRGDRTVDAVAPPRPAPVPVIVGSGLAPDPAPSDVLRHPTREPRSSSPSPYNESEAPQDVAGDLPDAAPAPVPVPVPVPPAKKVPAVVVAPRPAPPPSSPPVDTSARAVTARYREVGALVAAHATDADATAEFRRIDLLTALRSEADRVAALALLDRIAARL